MQYDLVGGSGGPSPEYFWFLMPFDKYFETHWFVLLPIFYNSIYSYKNENAKGGKELHVGANASHPQSNPGGNRE